MSTDVRDIDLLKTWLLSDPLNFTRYFFRQQYNRKFIIGQHHKIIAEALNRVLAGESKRLMINIAPRYSKTEMVVKSFAAMGFGLNPEAKFIHLSYSDDLVRDNSLGVQAIMLEPEYQRIFQARPISHASKKWSTEQGGGFYAVSSSGQVTGFGAGLVDDPDAEMDDYMLSIAGSSGFGGAIIIDDPIKPDDALSPTMRDKVNNKFDSTIRNRVNSRNTPIIIIMQRVHEMDLCGYLLNKEPDEWDVVSLPCIIEKDGERQALWEFKHTLEELDALREKNPYVFETQYMQDPKPLVGLMYERGFKEYEAIPITRSMVAKNYTDTADTGKDYLCSICYVETESGNYVTDVLYTQKTMEYTEPKTAEMLTKNKTQVAVIESNNGGRGFARNVEQQVRVLGNYTTHFEWFHQSENKDVRIFSKSAEVQNMTYFPKGWDRLWPEFYGALTSFMKVVGNAHDDAPDVLTGMIEMRGSVEDNSEFIRRVEMLI